MSLVAANLAPACAISAIRLLLPVAGGQIPGNQQRRMGIGAFRRHGKIRQQTRFIDQRQSFGALFRDQSCGLAQSSGHGSALVGEIGAGFQVQRFDINHRIVQQLAGQSMAKRRAPALVTVRHMLVDQGVQALVERDGRVLQRPGRWPPYGRQHAGEGAALYVVERVGLVASGMNEGFLVPGHALQHTQLEQCAEYRHQLAPFVLSAQT